VNQKKMLIFLIQFVFEAVAVKLRRVFF